MPTGSEASWREGLIQASIVEKEKTIRQRCRIV